MKVDQEIARIATYLKLRGFNYIRFARAPIAAPLRSPDPVPIIAQEQVVPVARETVVPVAREAVVPVAREAVVPVAREAAMPAPSEQIVPAARVQAAPAATISRMPMPADTARARPPAARRFRLLSDVRETDLASQDDPPERNPGATRLLRDVRATIGRSAPPDTDAPAIRRGRTLSPKMFS